MAPLVSLHHLDYLEPMFPNYTRIDSLKSLIKAYQIDPARIIQQSFCYDHMQKWSISIAWGHSVQLYLSMIPANDLQTPLQTFKTWRSWRNGPFTFNTRPVSSDPCKHPILYFLNEVLEVGKSGTVTTYERYVDKEGKRCERADYVHAMSVQRFIVSSLKMDTEYWEKVRILCFIFSCTCMYKYNAVSYSYEALKDVITVTDLTITTNRFLVDSAVRLWIVEA